MLGGVWAIVMIVVFVETLGGKFIIIVNNIFLLFGVWMALWFLTGCGCRGVSLSTCRSILERLCGRRS